MQRKLEPEAMVHEAPSPEAPAAPSPIEDLVAPDPIRPGATLAGEVLDARHPTLAGRALVRWEGASGPLERWLPTLHGLSLRPGDRVLVTRPENWPEPVVTGVIDGFAMRPERPPLPGPAIALQRDEALRVTGAEGEPLLEVRATDEGPVVRLLQSDVELVLPGELRINARSIDLTARQGEVKIHASDDVIVKGETIQLN